MGQILQRRERVGLLAGDEPHTAAQDHQAGRPWALVLGELLPAHQGDHRLPQAVDRVRKGVGGAQGALHRGVREQLAGQVVQIHRARGVHVPIVLRAPERGRAGDPKASGRSSAQTVSMADPLTVVTDAEQPYAALGARSRRRLLQLLRATDEPVGAAELAVSVGLHVTTVRSHLRVLEAAGLVVRTESPRTGRGRPRQCYAPSDALGGHGDGHQELAELLAGALGAGGAQGRRQAEDAGRRWAEREVPATREISWEAAVGGVGELFARVGFAPRRIGSDGYRLALEACPFRDVARAHPEIVCTLHLGLMREALTRQGQGELAESAHLQPFVAPDLCLADIPEPAAAGGSAG